ncbi:testican-2 isoform X1 [Chiroxiphia lanceolata]|uniref:testican-2 n=2 Tax=Pipridae TaxID=114313 RepID=UPI0013CEA745|nr:testican-2 isoform X1 [Chiroxiphia lanceolata]XP_051655728.1 testican-2 [Manacus candei]
MRGCGGRRALLALLALLLPAAAAGPGPAAGPATGPGPAAAGESPGNFMEDEQWLSSISQYGGRIKHWNRFRDEVEDDYIKSWEDNQPGDEALDTTKDPCQKVKCSRHKVCVAQGYQRAMCISRKKLEHRIKPLGPKAHGGCKPCHAAPLAAVCGSDGHTYSSACKLEQQACLASKQLTVRCEGQCPCPTPHGPTGDGKQDLCTGQDLADLGDRLRDWFQLLRENAKQNGSGGLPASPATALERSVAATCKEAVGWMFARLDTSGDMFLEAAELGAINLDKYEVCIRAFFNSCDTSRDGRVSAPEWCFCFWREKPPCLRELEKIQIQEATKKKPGTFIPSCDEDGYYRRAQCEPGGGECWCVDQHGAELTGTRGHGSPDCDEATGFSGDFGSSVGWEDEEEKEPEEAGEEGEEEEGEAGEGDDGGYIW